MTGVAVASLLTALWQRLAAWFAQAVPAEPVPAARDDQHASEARRKSIHDVTLEQLGIAHWSCHTHF